MSTLDKGSTDPSQLNEGGGTDGEDLKPREFFWDSVILYIVSVILALSAVDALTEFIRGTGVSCVTGEGIDEGLKEYINSYCAGSLPITEYIPAFIFIHGLAISIPHFLWLATHGGQFDYFFSVVKKLDHFRDQTTGKYSKENIDLVRQLEQSFTTFGRNSIYWLYIGKLGLQFVFALASLVLAIYYFTDFDIYFHCPRNNDTDDEFWPLSTSVMCVFTSLKLLYWIRVADVLLISLIVCSLLWGFWFCVSGHPTELGSENVARFSFQSGIQPEFYVSHCWYAPRRLSGFLVGFLTLPFIPPRVLTDLDFMLLKLFRTNAGFGKIVKDIQIQLRIQNMIEQDHISTNLFHRNWADSEIEVDIPENDLKWVFKSWPNSVFEEHSQETLKLQVPNSIRGAILGLSSLSAKGTGAMSITFNTTGYGLALSRLFRKTADVVFTNTKRGMEVDTEMPSEDIVKQLVDIVKNSSSRITVTIPDDFLMSHEEYSAEFYQRIRPIWTNDDADEDDDYEDRIIKTSFLIVGPMNEDQTTIMNLFLHEICSDPDQLDDGCVIVLIRPVRIAGKGTSEEFPGLRGRIQSSKYRLLPEKVQSKQIVPPNCTALNVEVTVSNERLCWPSDLTPPGDQECSTKDTATITTIQLSNRITPLEVEETDKQETAFVTIPVHDPVSTEGSAEDTASRTRKAATPNQINLLCGDVNTSFEVCVFKFVYLDEWRVGLKNEDGSENDNVGLEDEDSSEVEKGLLPKIENRDK